MGGDLSGMKWISANTTTANSIYLNSKKIEGVEFKGFSPSVAYVDEISNSYEIMSKPVSVSMDIPLFGISDETYKLLFGKTNPNKVKYVPGENCLF